MVRCARLSLTLRRHMSMTRSGRPVLRAPAAPKAVNGPPQTPDPSAHAFLQHMHSVKGILGARAGAELCPYAPGEGRVRIAGRIALANYGGIMGYFGVSWGIVGQLLGIMGYYGLVRIPAGLLLIVGGLLYQSPRTVVCGPDTAGDT